MKRGYTVAIFYAPSLGCVRFYLKDLILISMKYFLNQIFVTLGVIFFILIIVATYFFITDPYNLKPLVFGSDGIFQTQSTSTTTADTAGADVGFTLSEPQKQALINLGIDPAKVPSLVTAEQEQCFVRTLGAARVSEIKNGAVPGPVEFVKAKGCI